MTWSYGAGCDGSGGFLPTVAVDGCTVPGGPVTIAIENGLGGATAILFLGASEASLPLQGGCTLLVDIAAAFALPLGGAGPGNGSISFLSTIDPAAPTPTTVFFQAFVLDAGGGPTAAFSASRGLAMTID
jgi:hypothetical protein